MLLATAFLNVPQVDTGVSLLEAGTTGNLLALFQYFRQEWMTNERLPLWNVRNVNIRTNNHLESWHNRLNKKAGGIKLILRKRRDGNANQPGPFKNPAAGSIRQKNNKYAEKQRRVMIYTGEYTNDRRTLEL
ncbi:conserved hypothetical protein, partial [Trichinella spiralis]|uniref:hypothetical protein n=1 Tax=Trichinella spiralis TaxID=6334 RepID=UPI0001EFEA03